MERPILIGMLILLLAVGFTIGYLASGPTGFFGLGCEEVEEPYIDRDCEMVEYNETQCNMEDLEFSIKNMNSEAKCIEYEEQIGEELGIPTLICKKAVAYCYFDLTNLDDIKGVWTYAMMFTSNVKGEIESDETSKMIRSNNTYTFNWTYSIDDINERVSCSLKKVDIPQEEICFQVPKTKEECTPVTKYRNVTKC